MPSARLTAVVLCLAGAASAAPTWTLEAEPASSGGFIAYGVVIARNDINGATGQIHADSVDSFESPFPLGDDVLDFGGVITINAADAGPDSGVAAEMTMFTTLDGSGGAMVTAQLHSAGVVMRTGASASHVSLDPNNRAVFALRVTDAASDRPVHVTIQWAHDITMESPTSTSTDASLMGNARLGREGDAFLATTISHLSGDEGDLPIANSGEHRITLAPDDLARAILLHCVTQSFVAFDGEPGSAGPLEAGSYSADFTLIASLRQFCPGDTDGDDLVNFGDLNTVVGSFNATGSVGEHAGDINGDGVVDFADLNLTLTNFGQNGC